MKLSKLLLVIPALIVALGMVGLLQKFGYARITGVNPRGTLADTFCIGPVGHEWCSNYLGSLIPTTSSAQDLGTAALPWRNAYLSGSLVTGTVTPTVLTSAAINALTGAVGRTYTCSDCTDTYTICVATGVLANQYREVGTATGCH